MDQPPKSEKPPKGPPPSSKRGDRVGGLASAPVRLALATVAGLGTYFATFSFASAVRIIAAWDIAAFCLLSFAWSFIWRASPGESARQAGREDPGRNVVTVIVLLSSTVSLFAAAVVLRQARTLAPEQAALWITLCLAAVVLAWLVSQTSWTLRYAHLYYRDTGDGIGGLTFPGCDTGPGPSDLDFAYFAFTIGMCFQVSDVTICDSGIRRAVLMHACQSFAFNTAIMALALNLAFGFLT